MNRRAHAKGQAAIIVAVALPVLLGMVGLVVDVGYLRYVQRQMQSAADAAAVGGAAEILYGNATATAQKDASRNGFTDGTNGVTVTVNNPPLSGPHAGSGGANYVEVIISQNQPTFFMKVLGWNSVQMKARAVGFLTSGPNCLYALRSDNYPGAFKLTPGGNYNVQANCGIAINSTNNSALITNGNSLTASWIGIVGNCSDCDANVSPSPERGIIPAVDPLGYLPNPVPSGFPRDYGTIVGDITLQPGIYSNGINIGYPAATKKVPHPAGPDVTFAPGAYYITGGDFTVTSPNTDNDNADGLAYMHPNLHGSGVFLYIGTGSKVLFQGGNGHFANSYGGLSAPTTGTYAGILFFQARGTTSYTANVSSGLGDGFTGTLYFPSVSLKYSNSMPNAATYTIMVANTLDFYRDMSTVEMINYDTSGLPNGSPIKKSVLAE